MSEGSRVMTTTIRWRERKWTRKRRLPIRKKTPVFSPFSAPPFHPSCPKVDGCVGHPVVSPFRAHKTVAPGRVRLKRHLWIGQSGGTWSYLPVVLRHGRGEPGRFYSRARTPRQFGILATITYCDLDGGRSGSGLASKQAVQGAQDRLEHDDTHGGRRAFTTTTGVKRKRISEKKK